MTKFQNIINKTKRRMAAARAVYVTGRVLVVAIVIALVVLIVDRLMNFDLPTVTYIAIVAAGVAIGVITALLSKINTLSVAVRLDRRLDLRDRLGTAEAIRSGEISDDEFGQLITRDAERVAQRIDVKAATPIRFSNDWSLAGLLIIALGAAIAFVPALDRSSKGQSPLELAEQKEQLHQQQKEIADTIEEAVADVDDELLDEELREDLEALNRLAQQLSDDDAQSENDLADARNQSAAELGSIAKRLEEQSERNSQTIDSIAERFAGMEKTQAPMKSQEFEEALRNGEFENAAEILDELKREAEQMSEVERDAVAEHFRNMSEQLSEDDAPTVNDEELDPIVDAMRHLGMDDETVDAILDEEKTVDEIASEIEDQGVDEDIARELAEDIKRNQEQEEIDQQADEQTKDIADALNEAADDIAQEESQQDNSQENENASQADSSSDESQDQQDAQSQEGIEKREVKNGESKKQTDSEQQQQIAKEQDQEKGQRQEERTAEQGEEEVKEQGKDQDTKEPGQQTFDPADPNTPKQEEASQEEDKQQQQKANDQSTEKPASGKEDANAKKNPSKNLGKALRELAKKAQDAAKGKKISKRMREAAKKLADSLSDEEKRELAEKWMGEFNKPKDSNPLPDGGNNPKNTTGSYADRIVQNTKDKLEADIEDVDVTGDNPGAKSIFEWLSDQPIEGDPQRTTQSKQVVRKARSAAEHAVGESTVPKRYHDLIQRYFGKLSDTVEKAEKQTSKTGTTTKEVPAKSKTEDDS